MKLLLMTACLVAQDKAEELFGKFEKKFADAKSVSMKVTSTTVMKNGEAENKLVVGMTIRFKAGDKFVIGLAQTAGTGGVRETFCKSDGKKRASSSGGRVIENAVPAGASRLLLAGVTRVSLAAVVKPVTVATKEKFPDPSEMWKMADLRFGAKEKVGQVEATVFEYALKAEGFEMQVTLWIDAEKWVPLKRVTVMKSGEAVDTTTEIFESVSTAEIADTEFDHK